MKKILIVFWLCVIGFVVVSLRPERKEEQTTRRKEWTPEQRQEAIRQWSLTLFPPSMFYWKEVDSKEQTNGR